MYIVPGYVYRVLFDKMPYKTHDQITLFPLCNLTILGLLNTSLHVITMLSALEKKEEVVARQKPKFTK